MSSEKKTSPETTDTRKKTKLLMKNNKTSDRDWEGLPDHLIELIIERLPVIDCLSFSNVCKLFRGITTKLFDGGSRGIPLLVKPGQIIKSNTKLRLYVLDKNKSLSLDISTPEDIEGYIWGSYDDWLVLGRTSTKNIHITLFNPFSGEKVMLPNAENIWRRNVNNYLQHRVVVSSVPNDTRCIYMIVVPNRAAFWTSGAQQWFVIPLMSNRIIRDALYYEGNFYILTYGYEMVIIEEKSVADMLERGNRFGVSDLIIRNLKLQFPVRDITGPYTLHLVESSGDILFTILTFYNADPHVHDPPGFQTYRMDVSQMAWVKLESLGNHVIFLGKSCSRSFHAKELGDDTLANKIYFRNADCTEKKWGVFSLQKESTRSPALSTKARHWAGIWITAPMSWYLRQTLKH